MNIQQRCNKWERDMTKWAASGYRGSAPRKPWGYDLHRQGADPLKLASKPTVPCAGGNLVDPSKVSDAAPTPLDHFHAVEQQFFF